MTIALRGQHLRGRLGALEIYGVDHCQSLSWAQSAGGLESSEEAQPEKFHVESASYMSDKLGF